MRALGSKRRAGLILGAAASVLAMAAFTGCDLQEDADLERGEQLFTQECGSCHVLTGAGTNGEVGPNLDLAFADARASGMDQDTIEGVVQQQIANPRPADPEDTEVYMPPNLVEGEDAEAVAAYVASVAGVPGIEAPEFLAPEFFATNCGGCHTLAAAGTTGTTGPNLDEVLAGASPADIERQIVDPESEITPGYSGGIMPNNYDQILTPPQLRQLVQYLQQSAGGGGAGGGGGGGG
jgi:mono/diheme cytochrome c family protein